MANRSQGRPLLEFCLTLYPAQRTDLESVATFSGSGEDWARYQTVRVPGFDGTQSIDLSACWQSVMQAGLTQIECEVVGRETIVKWSGTQQLLDRYTLVGKFKYA